MNTTKSDVQSIALHDSEQSKIQAIPSTKSSCHQSSTSTSNHFIHKSVLPPNTSSSLHSQFCPAASGFPDKVVPDMI
jgi:hypothetical protein